MTYITVSYFLLSVFTVYRSANLYLVGFFLAVGLWLIHLTLVFGQILQTSNNWFLPLDYTWSLGPFLYFYVRKLTRPKQAFERIDFLHFIFPAYQAFWQVALFLLPISARTWLFTQVGDPLLGEFDNYFMGFAMLLYCLMAWRIWYPKRASITEAHSTYPSINRWLFRLLITLTSCAAILALANILLADIMRRTIGLDLYEGPLFHEATTLIYTLASYIVAGLAFSFNQLTEQAFEANRSTRKQTYAISPEQLQAYQTQLSEYLTSHQPYLDGNITLESMAQTLGIPYRQLSYVVNEAHPAGFNALINQLRVQAACDLLVKQSHSHRSVLEIGLSVGFNSKSTFNRVFKQAVGQTPSQFRKEKRLKSSMTP